MIWVTLILLLVIVYLIIDRKKGSAGKGNAEKGSIDYSQAYQAKYLLTKNEWYEYKKLQQYAENKGWIVCPKVRVLDLIEPRKGQKNYLALINKVQSKHVDFVLCDKDLHIKAIIELDDNSHDKADRQARDEFLNTILQSVGYKVIHTRGITEETLNFDAPQITTQV